MPYYLVTKWFGSFLFDNENHIIKKILFPQDEQVLEDYLTIMHHQEILDVECRLAGDKNPIVCEKRLQSIGLFQPTVSFFQEVQSSIESFTYPPELLYNVVVSLTNKQVNHSLSLPDYQVIQQVNALDELQHIVNVLSERIDAWNVYQNEEMNQQPITDALEHIQRNTILLKQHLEESIKQIAPNITEIVGPMIAARLLACAGSLHKLAILPSSSIQLLGAEKALFRFKKEGGKPPKHGVIFQHSFIGKAPYSKRGKHARLLSAKLAIAAKADMFTKRFIAPDLKAEFKDEL
ncbi:MAG: hypothetical protein QCI00_02800 [Candidatus Thermoplasmatota archaeon]|nr:hypothetical protein [Candidatus Thermoplasmatota archaeon]